ncbi:hypothetical protein O181_003641 [Austropuccinia psidii MF-1]|uniref:Uncharacterized protein n=1 Tax=Austropuccinia psidii MF-1 TaxID=1389203 RepID=A0A9Q3BFC3_9BASI|nr:hypothetical protein [Austropuccinia psidii MF-1]
MASVVNPGKAWKWMNLVKEEELNMKWWTRKAGNSLGFWEQLDLGISCQQVEKLNVLNDAQWKDSPSNFSLPSAFVSVGKSSTLLNIFTTPWLWILEIGTSELE